MKGDNFCKDCGWYGHEDGDCPEQVDECEHCGGEHDSEDCDVDECICAHCGTHIQNDDCEDRGLPEKHVTPADWKNISRKRAFRSGGIIV